MRGAQWPPLQDSFKRNHNAVHALEHSISYLLIHYNDHSEKAMAAHSSTLAWKIPWTEEPGGLQSMESRRIRQDWATPLLLFVFMHWRRKWQPLQYSCPENPRDAGAWWAAVYRVAQSQTWLKQLSSSSTIVLNPYSILESPGKETVNYILSWPKSSFRLSINILLKNPN